MALFPASGGNSESAIVDTERKIGTIKVGGVEKSRYEKIVDTGALPNNTTNTINVSTNYEGLLSITGAGFATTGTAVPMPYLSANAFVQVVVTNTDIKITTNANLSGYTKSYVHLEYYK